MARSGRGDRLSFNLTRPAKQPGTLSMRKRMEREGVR